MAGKAGTAAAGPYMSATHLGLGVVHKGRPHRGVGGESAKWDTLRTGGGGGGSRPCGRPQRVRKSAENAESRVKIGRKSRENGRKSRENRPKTVKIRSFSALMHTLLTSPLSRQIRLGNTWLTLEINVINVI